MTVRAIFEGIDRRIELDKEDSDSAYFQAFNAKAGILNQVSDGWSPSMRWR